MIIYLHNWGWGRVLSAVRITIITTTILNESETLWKDLGGWVPSRAYRDPPLDTLPYTTLNYTALHTTLKFTTLQYSNPIHTTLHYTAVQSGDPIILDIAM